MEEKVSVDRGIYEIVRSQIEHEDNLLCQRLNWLIMSQSFFFTAFAIVSSNLTHGEHAALLDLLPIAAISVTVLLFVATIGGVRAMSRLRGYAAGTNELLPAVQGDELNRWLGLAAPLILPGIFLILWLDLILKR